jgi:hypothetical protein
MLNCRSCARNQLSGLISIHAPGISRSFSTTPHVAVRKNTITSLKTLARKSSLTSPTAFKLHPNDKTPPRWLREEVARNKSRLDQVPEKDREPKDPRYVRIPQGTRGNYTRETRDPKDVVMQVEDYLRVGDVAKAHGLVERVSGKIGTVVAWNQLIRNAMDGGKYQRALRYYNDVCLSLGGENKR